MVRLRGVLCTVEAHSSRVGHWPAWRPQWLLVCSAFQCAKFRLVTYQLKALAHHTYVPRTISREENEAARQSQAVKCSVGRTWDMGALAWDWETAMRSARVPRASRDEVAVLHPPRHWTARRMCATKEGAFKLVCHQSIFCTLTRYTPQGPNGCPADWRSDPDF